MKDQIIETIKGLDTSSKDLLYDVVSDLSSVPESYIKELEDKKRSIKSEIDSIYEDISIIKNRIENLQDILSKIKVEDDDNIGLYIYKYFILKELYVLNQKCIDLTPNDLIKEKKMISNIIEINKVKRKIFEASEREYNASRS